MRKVFVHFKNQALCTSAQDAICFINSLNGISCNPYTERLIVDLFDGKKDYNGGEISELATTGCRNSRIKIYDALGETIEDHIANYEDKCNELRQARLKKSKEAMEQRLSELSDQKKGWYYVSVENVRVDGFRTAGNDRPKFKNFSVELLAESGADAYKKVSEHLSDTFPTELTTSDFTYAAHFLPGSTSPDFYFEFLGVKTDDGYSKAIYPF